MDLVSRRFWASSGCRGPTAGPVAIGAVGVDCCHDVRAGPERLLAQETIEPGTGLLTGLAGPPLWMK